MTKEQFEEKIMKLSEKDKDGDTWVETRNVFAVFRKFLKELNIELLSSMYLELKPLVDSQKITEDEENNVEELISRRLFNRIEQIKDYCPICKGKCKNHGRKNYIYETEE